MLLHERRDTDAAERFFRRLLDHAGSPPERITTDKLGSYAAAVERLPQLACIEHLQVRSSMRCNNRVEQAHLTFTRGSGPSRMRVLTRVVLTPTLIHLKRQI